MQKVAFDRRLWLVVSGRQPGSGRQVFDRGFLNSQFPPTHAAVISCCESTSSAGGLRSCPQSQLKPHDRRIPNTPGDLSEWPLRERLESSSWRAFDLLRVFDLRTHGRLSSRVGPALESQPPLRRYTTSRRCARIVPRETYGPRDRQSSRPIRTRREEP